jgi:hypothetical protein
MSLGVILAILMALKGHSVTSKGHFGVSMLVAAGVISSYYSSSYSSASRSLGDHLSSAVRSLGVILAPWSHSGYFTSMQWFAEHSSPANSSPENSSPDNSSQLRTLQSR